VNAFFTPREKLLIKSEIRQFFLQRRALHFVPLLIGGVFLIAWMYPVGSPFAAIVIVVVLGLELQFNNIFFRTPKELEAMSLFPIAWERIVFVKNVATLLLALLLMMVTAMALLYFSPEVISPDKFWNAVCYVATVMFPLLHFGNEQSVQRPRRESGLLLADVIEATWMAINLFLVSIPAYLFMDVIRVRELCLVYGLFTAFYWYRVSIPKTAQRIGKESATICSNL